MKKLSKASEIWRVNANKEDIKEAINYATISLPWTFDRMRYGVAKQKNMNKRLINIMKGVLNQTLLERILTKKGYKCSKDWTKYRESDIFDFSINGKVFDVKTGHIYSEYSKQWGRALFSPKLLIKNKDYPGPEWVHFFPVCLTLSQITYKEHKDGYIFGKAETHEDITKRSPQKNDNGFWCSVPFGKASIFFHNRILIKAREENKRGFKIRIKWKRPQQTLTSNNNNNKIIVYLFGEWDGKRQNEKIILKANELRLSKKDFSSLSCIRCDHPIKMNDFDTLIFSVNNKFRKSIGTTSNPLENINDSNFEWELTNQNFINLQIPDDYKVYWIGFTTPKVFFKEFTKYKCYFIPLPGRDINQEGRLTNNFKEKLMNMDRRKKRYIEEGLNVLAPDFTPLIKGSKFQGGLLISQMKGMIPIGAASYTYPPQPGAFPESAIYILPCDIYRMRDI